MGVDVTDCQPDHVCANHPIHAQAKIIRQRMTIDRLLREVVALRALMERASDAFTRIANYRILDDAAPHGMRSPFDADIPHRELTRRPGGGDHIEIECHRVDEAIRAALAAQAGGEGER